MGILRMRLGETILKPYNKLMEKYREIALVDTTMGLMNWDLETYMPPQGIALRSNQLSVLERISHRMSTSDDLASLLRESEKGADSLDEVQRRNLQLLRREHDIAVSLPEDLVADLAGQTATARDAWAKAKAAHNWRMFEPELQKLVDLSIKRAEATMHARGASCVFDAMIDDFERGMTHDQVASLFTDLRESLLPLIRKYSEASRGVDTSVLNRRVPVGIQRDVVRDAVGLIGYDTHTDNARGRIDETEHPFTNGYFDDVRITVHYHEDDPFDALLGGLHEAGHALYEQNLNHDWMYQPVGRAASMGIHEAMSRFAENMLGHSRHFWSFYLPRLNKLTGGAFSNIQLEELLRAINKVQPSKTRVTADEVTYSLHVAIRFEIERELFGGKLEVCELPHIWNDLYDKYLQIRFDHDGEGVMQDVHWSVGSYGYWQSYVLGNIYGGMFLRKLSEEIGAWSDEVGNGRPDVAMNWLRSSTQHWGALYDPGVLVEKVTGSALTVEPFIQYLKQKLSDLCG
jgi:carboxypeptidase Taq